MPSGVYIKTEKHRENLSIALMGRKTGFVPKTAFKKGHIPWNKDEKHKKECMVCRKVFWVNNFRKNKAKFCSRQCSNGYNITRTSLKGRKFPERTGENHPNWKGDKCKKRQQRNDSAYVNWMRSIKKRDNNTCWLSNEECGGYNIVHHIFNWIKYPKLRYELTNGITLCQAHHPIKRAKEKLFRKLFSYLVNQE